MTTLKWDCYFDWADDVDLAVRKVADNPLCEPDLLRGLWDINRNQIPVKVYVIRDKNDDVVGVVPLKRRGRSSWQLLSYYCMPYAPLMVNPAHTLEVLKRISAEVDCPNISLPGDLSPLSFLRPETSWVIDTSMTFEQFLSDRKYVREDRRTRRKSESLNIRHDHYCDIPQALDIWKSKWDGRGSHHTAAARDEMQFVCDYMIARGRMKTISAYDGDVFVGLMAAITAGDRAYGTFISVIDDYKEAQPGIRLVLEGISWACASHIAALDTLRPSSLPKHKWAEAEVHGYRLVLCPFGSEFLGTALGTIKDTIHSFRDGRQHNANQPLAAHV